MKRFVCVFWAGCAVAVQAFTEVRLNDSALTDETGARVVFGTEGSYDTSACTKAAAFDGSTSTFFDPPSAVASSGGGWVGLGWTTPKVCTRVRYTGRGGGLAIRMIGALIQGANEPDFSDAQTVHVLAPPDKWSGTTWVSEPCRCPAAMQSWKYFRLYTPLGYPASTTNCCAGNVSELEFWGDEPPAAGEEEPAPPAVTLAAQMNGRMNFHCAAAARVVEIHRRSTRDPVWRSWHSSASITSQTITVVRPGFVADTSEYRVRALNIGRTSDWTNVVVDATYPLAGTWIGTPGSWETNASRTGSAAFDGDMTTFYDALEPDGSWTGLDFGRLRTVTGLRYYPRREDGRMVGGTFQVANNADFSDAVTVHTVSEPPSVGMVTSVMFDIPVVGRYARYISPDNGYGNIAECEFVGEPGIAVTPTKLTVARSDLTNQFAVLAWTPTQADGMSSTCVWRAIGPGGPWTNCVAVLPTAQTNWTDTAARVGVKCWYRLGYRIDEDGQHLVGDLSADRVAFRRGARIDRDWDALTAPRAGATPFEYVKSWSTSGAGAAKLFDGSTGTFADIVGADGGSDGGGLMAGLAFDEPYGLVCARGLPRPQQSGRANGHRVYGSSDASTATNTWTRTCLTPGFYSNGDVWSTVEAFDPGRTFTRLFISKPGGKGFCNLAELELYGWRAADVAEVLQGPQEVTALPQADGVHLSWFGCPAAEGYRVERAVNDSANWTTVATVTDDVWTDADVRYDGHIYCYRVTACRGAETAFSDELRIIPYVAGNGTGLSGVYTWPFRRDSHAVPQTVVTNLDASLSFGWGTNKLISAAAGSSNYVHIAWTGRLVIPFDGIYAFTTAADNWLTLRIDDQFLVNAWGTNTPNTTVRVPLAAGAHPIRIDYAEDTGNASFSLTWGGCVLPGPIPATQLVPEIPDESPWEGNRSFRSSLLGAALLDGDRILLGANGSDLTGKNNSYHFLWRTWHGDFDCRMHAKAIDLVHGSKALIMARAGLDVTAPYIASALMVHDGVSYSIGTKRCMTEGGDTLDMSPPWTGSGRLEGDLRLVRAGDTFRCYWRRDAAAPWTLYYTCTFDAGVFGDEVYIGPASCRLGARTQPMFHEITGFTLGKRVSGTLLLVR